MVLNKCSICKFDDDKTIENLYEVEGKPVCVLCLKALDTWAFDDKMED